jgi:cyclopropane-fatty-acyl-phospholipid synthase
VVVIGMLEHVGYKHYATMIDVVKRCLKDDGLFLLHTVGGSITQHAFDPWLQKYVFPDGSIPSAKQITTVVEGKFRIEDWHNFGADYDKTLLCWFENFDKHWSELSKDYDEQFYRIWKYYLLSCAGIFRSRSNHIWQIVLSKKGVPGGYTSIR